MRILQAHNRHATRGGADHVVDTEAELLRAAGHEVLQFFTEPAAPDTADGAWVTRVKAAADAVWNRGEAARLDDVLTTARPDVLHVHTPFPLMSPAVFRVARARGVPSVGTVHSFRYDCIAGTLRRDGRICEDCVGHRVKLAGLRHRCYHQSLPASAAMTLSLAVHRPTMREHIDRMLPLTTFAADILHRDGIPPSHVTVKPNCVADPGPPRPLEARRGGALFVGRLVEEKGVATLVAAWRDHAPGIPLTVVGDGPLRDLVEAAAADGVLTFRGWLDPEEVAAMQADSLVTVVPSEWYEAGPPLVLLQALAAGTPVVCSDLQNICATSVEAHAAVPFRVGDPASLADAVRRCLTDAEAHALQARGLYLRDHTPSGALAALERIYSEVTR